MEQKWQGFTLLEVIIVIIIIGVLASLALPRLFAVIEASRAAEAITAMSTIRASLERYYLMNNGTFGPGAINTLLFSKMSSPINKLDIADPAFSPGSHFDYYVQSGEYAFGLEEYYFIAAYRNTRDGGDINQGILMTWNINQGVSFGSNNITAGAKDGQIHWGATEAYKNSVP